MNTVDEKNTVEEKRRLVRVVTYGKSLEAVEKELLASLMDCPQVLVSTVNADGRAPSPKGDAAIADWAETLSQAQGLGWQRVGRDVLFAKRPVFAKPSG